MKATAIAPSNIAFIKYWGKKDERLRLPANGSISMNLSGLTTTTTVEFSDRHKEDIVIINDQITQGIRKKRVIEHLDRIRKIGGFVQKAKVASVNSFPASSGLSSSASAFAALTLAAASSLGLKLTERQLSILARQASGSASRSIPSGFVEWFAGDSDATSFTKSIYPPGYWDLRDVVVVVADKEKEVSTTEGQKNAFSNPFFKERLRHIDDKIKKLKDFLKEKDFTKFGELVEDEALELHAVILTSKPSLIYWYPETIQIMRLTRIWRRDGLPVYFTVNTGHDVHLICEEKTVGKLCRRLKEIRKIKDIIINQPFDGARIVDSHLFYD